MGKKDAVVINRADLVEVRVSRFAIEASTLGLAPGVFPAKLQVNDPTFGNGLHFTLERKCIDGGEYLQQFGCVRITILND